MVELDFDLERDVPELTGKVILITGGTKGLGAATAKMLASRNPAKIYITGRNRDAAQRVITDIQTSYTSTEIIWISCDHTNLASVKEAAETISARESRLDVLMANAGVMALPPGLTNDGYEIQFGVNHVAHALFIQKLLGLLQKTAKEHGEARILPISSLALILAPRQHGIVFDDLKTTQDYWILGKWQRYAQSKLANLLYGRELARRYPEILTLVVDPGPSNTGLVSSLGFMDKMIVYLGNMNKFLEDDQGHLNQVWAVGVPKDQVKQGEFYEPVGKPTQGYTHWCLDQQLAERLWDWTEKELEPWLG
ncbi:NAD(P)-binding protein [Hypomontagnella monticulosa]|nr:NAD(P)-binding protein [Hypomontagnella monticulosa]